MFSKIKNYSYKFVKKHQKDLVISFIFLILTLLLTWPKLISLSDTLSDPGDPQLISWLINHIQDNILSFNFNIFSSNTFYPFANNIAYTDHSLAIAMTTLPLRIFTGNPVFIYNIAFLLAFFLSGVGAYFLIKHYTNNRYASFIGGVIFAFAPIHFAQIGHLHILSYQWIPFAILFFEKYLKAHTRKNLILFIVFFLLESLTTFYYFGFLSLVILIILIYRFFTKGFRLNKKFVLHMAIAGLVILAVMVPLLLPYLQVSKFYSIQRTLNENILYSADIGDFIQVPNDNNIWGNRLNGPNDTQTTEHSLFPGLIATLLIIFSLGLVVWKRQELSHIKNFVLYYIVTVFSAVMAMGPVLHLFSKTLFIDNRYGIVMPYTVFYFLYPPLQALRVPSRFGAIMLIGIAVIGGIVITLILKRVRKTAFKVIIVSVLLLGLVVEYMSVQNPSYKVSTLYTEKNAWLRDNTPTNSVIMEYPSYIKSAFSDSEAYQETFPMLSSTLYKRNILNGYTGFFPPESTRLRLELSQNFNASFLSIFKSMGNFYIVAEKDTNYPAIPQATLELLDKKYEDSKYNIYTIKPEVPVADKDFDQVEITTNYKLQDGKTYLETTFRNETDKTFYFGESFTDLKIKKNNKSIDVYIDNPIFLRPSSQTMKTRLIDGKFTDGNIEFIKKDAKF